MGINLVYKTINCWRCSTKGTILQFIVQVDSCSWGEARKTAGKYVDRNLSHLKLDNRENVLYLENVLPHGVSKRLLPHHISFIEGRGFSPDLLVRLYDLYTVPPSSIYKFRLIIPVFLDGKIVTFVGRDVTGKADVPYKNAPVDKSIIPIKDCLYNLDTVNYKAILVEGPIDVWRIGPGAICTFGTQFTKNQISMLKGIKELFVMYDSKAKDPNAPKQCEKLAYSASSIVPKVEIIELSDGDPGDLPTSEVEKLRKETIDK